MTEISVFFKKKGMWKGRQYGGLLSIALCYALVAVTCGWIEFWSRSVISRESLAAIYSTYTKISKLIVLR
jgi:hypothetical protein